MELNSRPRPAAAAAAVPPAPRLLLRRQRRSEVSKQGGANKRHPSDSTRGLQRVAPFTAGPAAAQRMRASPLRNAVRTSSRLPHPPPFNPPGRLLSNTSASAMSTSPSLRRLLRRPPRGPPLRPGPRISTSSPPSSSWPPSTGGCSPWPPPRRRRWPLRQDRRPAWRSVTPSLHACTCTHTCTHASGPQDEDLLLSGGTHAAPLPPLHTHSPPAARLPAAAWPARFPQAARHVLAGPLARPRLDIPLSSYPEDQGDGRCRRAGRAAALGCHVMYVGCHVWTTSKCVSQEVGKELRAGGVEMPPLLELLEHARRTSQPKLPLLACCAPVDTNVRSIQPQNR